MYEPKLARFLSRDPLSQNGAALLSAMPDMTGVRSTRAAEDNNPYAYVDNNPVNFTDPSGLKKCPLPPADILAIMRRCLRSNWVDREGRLSLALVACIACQESDYRPCVKSGVPAVGIMQLVKKSAWTQCVQDNFGYDRPLSGKFTYDANKDDCCRRDPSQGTRLRCPPCDRDVWDWDVNICCGVYYLKWCRDRIRRRVPIGEMIRCYFGGPGANPNAPDVKAYHDSVMECLRDMRKKLPTPGFDFK